MKRTARARWTGGGKDGRGRLDTQSGVLRETPYSFSTRFAGEQGTNPEELIAAAHAGCFTMALSFMLEGAGLKPESLETQATLTLQQIEGGWKIAAIHLELRGSVPGTDQSQFEQHAQNAKANCPVSKVLNCEITLEARLTG